MKPGIRPQSNQFPTGFREPILRELLDHLGKLLAKEYVTLLTSDSRATPDERD
jgi:hypothetical protein